MPTPSKNQSHEGESNFESRVKEVDTIKEDGQKTPNGWSVVIKVGHVYPECLKK